jgi:hypothetical protein
MKTPAPRHCPPPRRYAQFGRALMALLASVCLASRPAYAEVAREDLLVAARALSFLRSPMVGEVRVGIVFDPQDASSQEAAQGVLKMLGDGLKVGNLMLKPVLVKVNELATAQVAVLFLPQGLPRAGAMIASTSRSKHLPCISFDLAQVTNGNCLMGVRSTPKIEIVVSRAAAIASGVEFAPIFRMIITEI